ncbi:probable cytochrome P450 313a4 [Stomoxys calcitrans]|uniref:probable cytochrome P450 313a4 n=1 Tax=Stomoxys calcitrans TaxID=35570 RepID=UPI0027E2FA86|nr:probable cytochrome P450 313a4 [Stomoxys calcitrans]
MIYCGPHLFLVTSDPEVVKDILTSKLCINKPDLVYDGIAHVIGRGLITLRGDNWYHERKIYNESFKIGKLQAILPVFNKKMKTLFHNIDEDIKNDKSTPLFYYTREYTLSASFETMIGRDLDKVDGDVKEILLNFSEAAEYASHLASNFIYLVAFVRKIAEKSIFKKALEVTKGIHQFISMSQKNYTKLRGTDPSYVPNIDTPMETLDRAVERNELKLEEATEGIFQLFIGTFETNSTALYFALIMLAMHPKIQERAYKHVCDIFPNNDNGEFVVTYAHLSQLGYLDMILNETMRVLPIVPQVGRKVEGGNLKLSNGVVLPEGLRILIDIYSLHRSKDIWGPNAHKFNPDNFLSSNSMERHPFAFIPFTKGIRSCIGIRYAEYNLKVALARLIKRYKFSSDAKMEDLIGENHIVLQFIHQPKVTVERRRTISSE